MSAQKGRFELNDDNYRNFKNEQGKDFQPLNLKALFPSLFGAGDTMSQRLEAIWRKASDACLEHEKGLYYFQRKGCIVHFTFENITGALAKNKIDVIGKYIKDSYDLSISSEDREIKLAGPAPGSKPKQAEKAGSGDKNLQKVLEGLRKNPEIKEVKLWAERTMQNLHVSNSIPQDMLKLLEEYKICYVPFWNAERGVVVGAGCELNPRGTCADNDGQLIRDNIALITAARREIERFLEQGRQASLLVPIYAKSMMEKEVADMIVTFLNKTSDPVRRSMIFDFRGMVQGQVPIAAKAPLEEISNVCRALIVDTGILTQPDMRNEAFKIHAYGCNFNSVNLPVDQKLNLMKKHATTYKERGAKAYVRNVPDIDTLQKVQELGFTYVSAPNVLKPKLSCPTVARMSLEEIKAL